MKAELRVTQYAAIFRKGRLLLLQDSGLMHPDIKGVWTFPGGHVDKGERDLFKALARELKEETSLDLNSARIYDAQIKEYHAGPTVVIYYVCEAGGDVKLDEESDDHRWVSSEDVSRLKLRDDAERRVIIKLLEEENE